MSKIIKMSNGKSAAKSRSKRSGKVQRLVIDTIEI
jgi:hypothetical protein